MNLSVQGHVGSGTLGLETRNDFLTLISRRKNLRARRRNLSPNCQAVAASNVARILSEQPIFQKSHHIAAYFARDGEVDLQVLIKQKANRHKQWFMPVLKVNKKSLGFSRYDKNSCLYLNQYGILEPINPANQILEAVDLDLILLPLVGFDRQGNRLGMGGGYYDRALANCSLKSDHGPTLLGIAHSCQECQHIDVKPWDIRLHMVITGSEVICVKQK